MITVTFVRHGESTDNLRHVWAGWADAPLSNHGMNQAKAIGQYFADNSVRLTTIYASPLKRAHSTAQAIFEAQPEPRPPFVVSPDIREQYFGEAEGKKWAMHLEKDLTREEHYTKGLYPVLYHRHEKFPGGENLVDLQERAERAIRELVLPHLVDAARNGWKKEGPHVALVSHGLCISELIAAMVRLDAESTEVGQGGRWTGLLNTAWTRVTVEIAGLEEGQTMELDPSNLPQLSVRVSHINQHTHLEGITVTMLDIDSGALLQKRQAGGIGSAAYDPAQSDIRAFFGGGVTKPTKKEEEDQTLEEGRSISNVYDEVGVEVEND